MNCRFLHARLHPRAIKSRAQLVADRTHLIDCHFDIRGRFLLLRCWSSDRPSMWTVRSVPGLGDREAESVRGELSWSWTGRPSAATDKRKRTKEWNETIYSFRRTDHRHFSSSKWYDEYFELFDQAGEGDIMPSSPVVELWELFTNSSPNIARDNRDAFLNISSDLNIDVIHRAVN